MGQLLAESDVFWKSPTVYDVAGLIGVFLGIVSIWLAFALARKQLQIDLKRVAEEAIERTKYELLIKELADGIRFMRDADTFWRNRDWDRGQMRIEDGLGMVVRLSQSPKVREEERLSLSKCVADIREIILSVSQHKQSKSNRGYLPAEKLHSIGALLIELERIRGRIADSR